MNLHNITHPLANIDTIVAYCTAYYGMEFRPDEGGRSLIYRVTYAGDFNNRLDERDTLTYTNRALAWDREGRPRLR